MTRRILFGTWLASLAVAASLLAQVAIPETPAGQALRAWLEQINSGDRAVMLKFQQTWFDSGARGTPEQRADGELKFHSQTGGFELRKVLKSDDGRITALVREKGGDRNFAEIEVEVSTAAQPSITSIRAQVVDAPAGEGEAPRSLRASEKEAISAGIAFADEQFAKDAFSGALAVARNGKTIAEKAWGYRDRAEKAPNRVDTKFAMGSMNKMFTAVAVLQLVQQGKLKLDQPFGTYLPDYPNKEAASAVTLHHLLSHTGGMGDIFGPEFDKNKEQLRDLKDYVALYGSRAPQFPAGSKWAYSNYGMLLAGYIVERVSGVSYYDYVRDHIFKPAGMTASASYWKTEKVDNLATGYTKEEGGKEWKSNYDTLPMRGTSAGGGFTTVQELVKFANALMAYKLLDRQNTELLATTKWKLRGNNGYAYGFMDREIDGLRVIGHGGGAPGMNGDLLIFPQTGYVVAVLANMDPPAAGRLADTIAKRLPAR